MIIFDRQYTDKCLTLCVTLNCHSIVNKFTFCMNSVLICWWKDEQMFLPIWIDEIGKIQDKAISEKSVSSISTDWSIQSISIKSDLLIFIDVSIDRSTNFYRLTTPGVSRGFRLRGLNNDICNDSIEPARQPRSQGSLLPALSPSVGRVVENPGNEVASKIEKTLSLKWVQYCWKASTLTSAPPLLPRLVPRPRSPLVSKKCVSSRTFIRFVSYMTGVLRGIKGRGPKKGREIGELDNTKINDWSRIWAFPF